MPEAVVDLTKLTNVPVGVIQGMIAAGTLPLDLVKNLITGAISWTELMAVLSEAEGVDVIATGVPEATPGAPAGEDVLAEFKATGRFITVAEIKQRGVNLAKAKKIESWAEGFVMAMQIMLIASGGV